MRSGSSFRLRRTLATARTMPVVASCRCGQRFLAQDHLLGRTVPCPACGNPLMIPTADDGELQLAPAQVQPQPQLHPKPGSQYSAQQYPAQPNPPQSNPLQPSARPYSSSASSSGSGSQLGWILSIGGGLVVLVLVLIAVIAISQSGGTKKEVADSSDDPSAETKSIAPPLPRRKAPTFDQPKRAPTPIPPPTAATNTNLFETASTMPAAGANKSEPKTAGPPVVDSPDFGKPAPGTIRASTKRSPPAISTRSLSALPDGLTAWHQQPSRTLTGILNPAKDDPPVAHLSWLTGLLPYLGYQEKFNELKLSESLTHAANLEVAETVIPEFQNPLDDRKTWDGHPFDGLALTHFAGMSGVEDARNVCAAQLPRSDPRAGVFGYSEVARPDSITDGTSQTIMIVGSGRLASPWLMGGGATIRGAREPLFDPVSGLGTQGLSSGGALVVMADGSVRHVSATIDPALFKAMCTIHGQDSVDFDAHAPAFDVKDLR
jgi:hypothetical protein